MTAQQLATKLRARRIGKDKWMALCPAHPDRHPSLSITPGRRGVLIRCRSNGCDPHAIVEAMGINFSDLFYGSLSPAVKVQVSLQQLKEDLLVQFESARMLMGMEPRKRNYWLAVARRTWREYQLVRCRVEPLEVYREWRARVWQCMTARRRELYLEGVWKDLQKSTSGA